VVREVNQDSARKSFAGQLPHQSPLVEPILQDPGGLKLDGLRLVHLEPEELVTLGSRHKA
jgi:hypothetical protein